MLDPSQHPLNRPKQPCNQLLIRFKDKGRSHNWLTGKNFGIRQYLSGTDYGGIIQLRLQVSPAPSVLIGPNMVLPPPVKRPDPTTALAADTLKPTNPVTPVIPNRAPKIKTTRDSMTALIQHTFLTLNHSNPNLTKSCWLCYDVSPPFYEGIAVLGDFNTTTDHHECRWTQQGTARLTLQSVSGHGLCLGTVPHTHRHLCNQTATVTRDDKYIAPPINSWWACSNGLTPCIYSNLLKNNQAIFCVLVQLIPRLTYYTEE